MSIYNSSDRFKFLYSTITSSISKVQANRACLGTYEEIPPREIVHTEEITQIKTRPFSYNIDFQNLVLLHKRHFELANYWFIFA